MAETKPKEKPTIYTQAEACLIVEIFEDLLEKYGITIPSADRDERDDPENTARLYGMDYFDMVDQVELRLIDILEKNSQGAKIVKNIVEVKINGGMRT